MGIWIYVPPPPPARLTPPPLPTPQPTLPMATIPRSQLKDWKLPTSPKRLSRRGRIFLVACLGFKPSISRFRVQCLNRSATLPPPPPPPRPPPPPPPPPPFEHQVYGRSTCPNKFPLYHLPSIARRAIYFLKSQELPAATAMRQLASCLWSP